MANSSPRMLSAKVAAQTLRTALKRDGAAGPLTVADAAARSGLALRDAESALLYLVKEVPSATLSATEKGELLFAFPGGVDAPVLGRNGVQRLWHKAKQVVLGVGKFVVRAWLTIAMVGYALAFLAIAIALMFANKGDDDDGPSFNIVGVIFRVLFESLYWTFHPFSPLQVHRSYGDDDDDVRDTVPFYERVNRFVFGEEPPPVDALELKRRLVAHIRASNGRIGAADVWRVTGLKKTDADAMMAELMLDYDGDVQVSDDGGIIYIFAALNRTSERGAVRRPPPIWQERVEAPAVTGNPAGKNLMIGALNGFNWIGSVLALSAGLTIDKIMWIINSAQSRVPLPAPDPSLPLVLGVIPFVMSTLIFALPLWRTLTRGQKVKAAAAENGRRAVLKTVLERAAGSSTTAAPRAAVDDDALKAAWQQATGTEATGHQLTQAVVALGGDVDLEASNTNGRTVYRFVDLEAELQALRATSPKTVAEERDVGQVVFRSDR